MTKTVLIVDDSLTVRMDLAEAFGEAGFDTRLAATLAEARDAMAHAGFDVVIIDMLLPDGDGVQLLEELRASRASDAVVIMLSTESEVRDRIRGLRTGADEYVGKPYDSGYVVGKSQELLRERRQAGAGAATVLVIDDSVTFREELRAALEAADYTVTTAGTGEDGLRLAASQRPTAILVDGVLPGIDGATVIRRVRLDAALRDVPCLLLTASEGMNAELRALDAGADSFVRKEESPEVILARLAAVLRRAGDRTHSDDTRSLLATKKILAVDDSPTYLEALSDALREEGYDVIPARSGEEAIELLAVQVVDCILLDLLMPGLSGQETCLRIKAAPSVRDVPLIMLTALDDRQAMIQGLRAGADDYISKSSEFEVLKARVRAQIRRRQFEDENRRIREDLLHAELEAAEARATRELAATRAVFVEELKRKNRELEAFNVSVEQALSESQQHYRALAESLPHLVWTCRPDGQCDFLSRQWVEYTGRPAEEQLGFGWAEQLHPDDRVRVQAKWADATARGDRFDIEFRIRRADGVYRWFKTRALPLRDAAGAVVKWFGSNTDVEDYKRSEHRLHAQLERLSLLDRLTRAIGERQDLDSILQVVASNLESQLPLDFCCVGLCDRADESIVITRVGARSAALAAELTMGEQARIPIDSNGLSRCVRGQLVHEPDITGMAFPFPHRLARGGLRSLVVAPLAVESNVFGVLIAARRDSPGFSSAECEFLRQLSEHIALAAHQAELHTALQRAYDDLRQTQHAVMQQERLKALGEMASGIAHDINNAISPVALYTESLLETEPQLSRQARDYLTTIQQAIEDVAQTVARMREFYREREPQLDLTPVSVNHLVHTVVNLTRARWSDMPQQRGVVIELAADLSPNDPTILGVESEVREALINLVFNAVDAMPEGGTLTVRTRATEEGAGAPGTSPRSVVHVEVADTGLGMDADTRRRCMEPFFTTKGERGTGLGLAMVYGTAQRHSAEIDVDSTPGRGTTIRLTFPASLAEADESTAPVPEAPRPSRLRVLIVDDDPLLLKSLRDVLEGDGHVVAAANGGQAGIDLFRETLASGKPFDAVITDLGMPHVDGGQVASGIKGIAPDVPVILLTGWGQRLIDDGNVPSHVDRVLNKPPRLLELRRALSEVMSESAVHSR